MDETDRAIVNALQGGFPICDEPYAAVARTLGIGEQALIDRLRALLERGVLTRFGPLYQIERMGGSFVLAALSAPEADFDRVAELVNAFPEVAHNYRREHRLNMWFVLATASAAQVPEIARRIEAATGLQVYLFPKEREYFVELRLVA
ncbi:MAG: Lrp/AsnC family transcriptional regulator [Gammaproteobacteria bacterium]|jgi:DNA-binding Lrp family transcriptional regulator|nr:Lrp/AsnC family transcriptional regulator [Gammaproteobacteria bacterium]MCU0972122.1 Lrp/AsnC family transcriptional regulator [Gammaproteobacteria bacterium]